MGGVAAALLASACGEGPAESLRRELVQVLEPVGGIRDVSARPFPYQGLGSFSVQAYADSAAVSAGEPVRVRVRTSSGDEEQIQLLPAAGFLPRQLLVAMRDGHHAAALRARMNASQLRFGSFGITGENGLLQVVGGDPAAALARVRGWPEVRMASPNALASIGGGSPVRPLGGALPMDEAAPSPGNGTLELRSGETATVEYRGVDGSPASVQQAFDSRSEPEMRAFVPLLVAEVERILYGDSATPPKLLIDAESFAAANWHASGTRITPAEAVAAGLPAGYQVVSASQAARCRQSVVPRDCSAVASGTFLYATGMFRTAVRYEMVANFRAPTTAPGCLIQQTFRFSWTGSAWQVESTSPISGC